MALNRNLVSASLITLKRNTPCNVQQLSLLGDDTSPIAYEPKADPHFSGLSIFTEVNTSQITQYIDSGQSLK